MLNFMVTPESHNERGFDLDKSLHIDLGINDGPGPVGWAPILILSCNVLYHRGAAPCRLPSPASLV